MNHPFLDQKMDRLGAATALLAVVGTVLDKLKQIAAGWWYTLIPDRRIEQLASERAVVCGACEHNTGAKCGLCGCPLQAKTRSPKSVCPDGRWTR